LTWINFVCNISELVRESKGEMRGVGGPLLTVSDLLSDLAVDGGNDHLDGGGGDASVPSSPLAAQQVEEADPSHLQRLFEVRVPFVSSFLISYASVDSPVMLFLAPSNSLSEYCI
jgi:hypothetical protein